MSVDLEDYFQAEALRDFCPRSSWDQAEDRTDGSVRRILDLLDEFGIKGTFFILGWTAKRHRDLVRRISDMGHEVASHGYNHELIYRQDPATFREDVRKARLLLQDLSGQEVAGYRAPSYTIVRKTMWALDIIAEEGHSYDSSIFPIKRLKYGIPDAPRRPHRIQLPNGKSVIEFPLPTVRLCLLNLPATGGAYLRIFPMSFQRWAINHHIQNQVPLVLNIHPWELDPGQPHFRLPFKTRLIHYHNLGQSVSRLRSLLSAGKFRPVLDVLRDLGY